MSVKTRIGSLFGISREKSKPEERIRLLTQLQANREKALRLIPENMKREFLSSVFPDKSLKKGISESLGKQIEGGERAEYLKLRIFYYISVKGFGLSLIGLSIKPDDVAKIMLEGINFKE
jgi:hypothetical protein